jgi:hypothetical protein
LCIGVALLSRKPSGWRKPRFIIVKETEIAEYQSLVPETPPMNRRNFLVTALGAGFALSVQPVVADTAIVTDSEGLDAREIQIPTADGNVPRIGSIKHLLGDRHSLLTGIGTCGQRSPRLGNRL